MSKKFKPGCQRPTIKKQNSSSVQVIEDNEREMNQTMIKVGKPAPEFTAAAYHQGEFVETSLSDYKGKWVMLCFYPGDYTFV